MKKNKADRKKLWVEIIKYPIHLDYLVDKTKTSFKINEEQISIKRGKGQYLTILLMSILIWGFVFLGPHSSSNMEFFLSALEPKIMPWIAIVFIVGMPLYAIVGLLKQKPALIINKNGIQVDDKQTILFSQVKYICFANQRHQNINGQRLKVYFKDGKEELFDISDLQWNREKTGWAIYHFLKESKNTTPNNV